MLAPAQPLAEFRGFDAADVDNRMTIAGTWRALAHVGRIELLILCISHRMA
jgi:hypothetical protein